MEIQDARLTKHRSIHFAEQQWTHETDRFEQANAKSSSVLSHQPEASVDIRSKQSDMTSDIK
jgi:hypothetical protein